MKLKGKNIAMLIGPGYEDLEFWVVYMRMKEEGANVDVIGMEKNKEYSSKHGCLTKKADFTAAEVLDEEYDGVLVPGGWTPDKIRRDKNVVELVRKNYEAGKIIGLICHAGLVGISAGIVDGKATGSEGIKDDIINAGGSWVDQPAFRDGNIVWGRVVKDIPAYCRELVSALAE
ncbi:type 1 glutamine amidotransferase domain-containing protein [Halanaerobium saccharolyticum]|uniref:type 1 glutamine amidotransferase domain-containing protein n=1 Tax=Halanaerobium saccharolyticum TaxID=43595 RepID=UPI003FCCCD5B